LGRRAGVARLQFGAERREFRLDTRQGECAAWIAAVTSFDNCRPLSLSTVPLDSLSL
jgi:hypothetical protein